MITKYIIFAFLWIIWCAVHSTMISLTVTDYLKRRLGTLFCFYRLFYNIIAIVMIIPVFLYSLTIQDQPLFYWNGWLRICQVSMFAITAFLGVAGSRHYDSLQYFGIRQIQKRKSQTLMSKSGELDNAGILTMVRHPWYLACIFFIWAWDPTISVIIRNIILTAYLIIGTYLEEKKLVLEFGEKYREYQKQVSMMIPYKWLKAKLHGIVIKKRRLRHEPPSM